MFFILPSLGLVEAVELVAGADLGGVARHPLGGQAGEAAHIRVRDRGPKDPLGALLRVLFLGSVHAVGDLESLEHLEQGVEGVDLAVGLAVARVRVGGALRVQRRLHARVQSTVLRRPRLRAPRPHSLVRTGLSAQALLLSGERGATPQPVQVAVRLGRGEPAALAEPVAAALSRESLRTSGTSTAAAAGVCAALVVAELVLALALTLRRRTVRQPGRLFHLIIHHWFTDTFQFLLVRFGLD